MFENFCSDIIQTMTCFAFESFNLKDECPRLMHCALKTSLAAILWATKLVSFLYPSVSEQSLV